MKIKRIGGFAIVVLGAFLWYGGGHLWRKTVGRQTPFNPVTRAILMGDVKGIDALANAGADLNARDSNRFNWTPLIIAAYHRQTNVVDYLLQKGVDPSLRDNDGQTALMYAIVNEDTNTVQILLRHGTKLKENWMTISNLCDARPTPRFWHSLFMEYTRTNSQ